MMTDYKAPFRVARIEHQSSLGGMRDSVVVILDASDQMIADPEIVSLLNAHARLSAQRCETCRFAGEPDNTVTFRLCIHPDLEDAQLEPPGSGAFVPLQADGQPFGCTAYQPKEDA